MAKVGNCLGGFSGKIGNVVYYYCNGNLYARRRPYRKMLVRSKNQQLWQNRFSACISFYRSLNGVCLKPIWEKLGKLMSVNGLNAFIASNIQAFNGEMGISNYEEIHFSKGVLKVPMGFEIRERKGNKLKVCWDTGWQTSLDAGTDRLCAGVIGALPGPLTELHEPAEEEMLQCYRAFAAGYNGMMERTANDMAAIKLETAVLHGGTLADGDAYALCLPGENGAEITELAGTHVLALVRALAARYGTIHFRLPAGARFAGLPEGKRIMFSMLCPLNAELLLAGSGAESLKTLLSEEIKPNCTLEFC